QRGAALLLRHVTRPERTGLLRLLAGRRATELGTRTRRRSGGVAGCWVLTTGELVAARLAVSTQLARTRLLEPAGLLDVAGRCRARLRLGGCGRGRSLRRIDPGLLRDSTPAGSLLLVQLLGGLVHRELLGGLVHRELLGGLVHRELLGGLVCLELLGGLVPLVSRLARRLGPGGTLLSSARTLLSSARVLRRGACIEGGCSGGLVGVGGTSGGLVGVGGTSGSLRTRFGTAGRLRGSGRGRLVGDPDLPPRGRRRPGRVGPPSLRWAPPVRRLRPSGRRVEAVRQGSSPGTCAGPARE